MYNPKDIILSMRNKILHQKHIKRFCLKNKNFTLHLTKSFWYRLIEGSSFCNPSYCYHVKDILHGVFNIVINRIMLKKFGPGSEYYSETTELDLKRSHM
jgi:hypothetical protein